MKTKERILRIGFNVLFISVLFLFVGVWTKTKAAKQIHDAGVISILSPVSPVVYGSSLEVKGIIKNFGDDTLTDIPVKFTINGIILSMGYLTTQLYPGDTALFNFPILPSPLASFELCVFTTLQGDINYNNDTLCTFIQVNPSSFITDKFLLGINSFDIYPNPVDEYCYIHCQTYKNTDFNFQLINELGQNVTVQNRLCEMENSTFRLDSKDLSDGLYVLILTLGEESFKRKLIIRH